MPVEAFCDLNCQFARMAGYPNEFIMTRDGNRSPGFKAEGEIDGSTRIKREKV